jgi:signal transduction histidine kinase
VRLVAVSRLIRSESMMQQAVTFEGHAADQLARESQELARNWAKRVARQWSQRQRRAMTFQLAGHMPEILRRVAEFVRDDESYSISGDATVVAALGTIARLRRGEGSSPAELMREFDLLAQVLDGACLEWLRTYPTTPEPASVVRVVGRVNRVPLLMGQISMEAYWAEEAPEKRPVSRDAQEFADMLAHELNTPLNAASMTAQLLEYAEGASTEARRLALVIRRQLDRAYAIMRDVRAASLMPTPDAPTQILPLGHVLGEVLAETRDQLRAEEVRLDVDEPIPAITVNTSRVKIVLVNLVRNAIK